MAGPFQAEVLYGCPFQIRTVIHRQAGTFAARKLERSKTIEVVQLDVPTRRNPRDEPERYTGVEAIYPQPHEEYIAQKQDGQSAVEKENAPEPVASAPPSVSQAVSDDAELDSTEPVLADAGFDITKILIIVVPALVLAGVSAFLILKTFKQKSATVTSHSSAILPPASPDDSVSPDRLVRYQCACGNSISMPVRYVGRRARCKQCGTVFLIS